MKTEHWGIPVNSESPITGVLSRNRFYEEYYDNRAIDLGFEEHCMDCPNEEHDHCYEYGDGPILIGFVFSKTLKKYVEDPEAAFSAIINGDTVQFTRSRWAVRSELCSPCFPGQAENAGDFLAYCPPFEDMRDEAVFKNREIVEIK